MKKKATLVMALATLLVAANISPALASHRTVVCSAGSPIASGASVRQVLVPENEVCTLDNVSVEQDVVVLEGGRLSVLGSDIGDDLRARSPGAIRIDCRPGACSDTSFIDDDVIVTDTVGVPANPAGGNFPANYVCNGTRVGGDLIIEESRASAPWQIGGGFCTIPQPGGAGGNVIDGDVEIESNAGTVNVENNVIERDVHVEDNTGQVTIRNNSIGDDLVVEDNTGGVVIQRNRIEDDLKCDDNTPAPTTTVSTPPGSVGNSVGDDAKGQCSGSNFTTPPAP